MGFKTVPKSECASTSFVFRLHWNVAPSLSGCLGRAIQLKTNGIEDINKGPKSRYMPMFDIQANMYVDETMLPTQLPQVTLGIMHICLYYGSDSNTPVTTLPEVHIK